MSDGYSDQSCETKDRTAARSLGRVTQVSLEEVLVHRDHFVGALHLHTDSILDHQ